MPAIDERHQEVIKKIKLVMKDISKNITVERMPVLDVPKIGYDNAAKVAKSAHARGTTLKEEAVRLGFVSAAEFDRLVQPEKMTRPG